MTSTSAAAAAGLLVALMALATSDGTGSEPSAANQPIEPAQPRHGAGQPAGEQPAQQLPGLRLGPRPGHAS